MAGGGHLGAQPGCSVTSDAYREDPPPPWWGSLALLLLFTLWCGCLVWWAGVHVGRSL